MYQKIQQFFCFLLLLSLTACVESQESSGFAMENVAVDTLETGMSRDQVLRIMGSPSTKSTFGREEWYYIGTTLTKTPFDLPDKVDQNVVLVAFNDDGTVSHIGNVTEADSRNVAFAEDATPSEGNELTILQQLLGNLGRFNAADQVNR